MKQVWICSMLAVVLLGLSACDNKKKSENIIAERMITVAPQAPIRMQDFSDERDVQWIGKQYHVSIHRHANDSLPKVKDETGQKFVDNAVELTVSRADRSVFFARTFTKSDFTQYLYANYSKTGILEGFVFAKADGDWLEFAASVSHPQTDEYIPLVVRLSRMGEIKIGVDSQMDTRSEKSEEAAPGV